MKPWTFDKCTKLAYVVDVHDGDTITVAMRIFTWAYTFKVRFVGIDAPELSTEAGKRARDYLQTLIGNKIVIIKFGKREKFGRELGTVFRFSNINEQMIKSGHAVFYDGKSARSSKKSDTD